MKAIVKAPAKINLTLDIVGKRADGYHDVAMVMQTVSLYDTVTVETIGESLFHRDRHSAKALEDHDRQGDPHAGGLGGRFL